MSSQISMNSAMYSAYRPVEENLLTYIEKIMPHRRFEHAGGVWRELPRKPLRLRRLAYLLATVGVGYWAYCTYYTVPVSVRLSPVIIRNIPVYLEANASIQANQTVTVHTQVDGQLSEIVFREGQDVKAGDVLAKLDPRNYQLQYDEAVANKVQDIAMLTQAKNDLTRLKTNAHRRSDAREMGKLIEEKASQVQQFEASVQSDQSTIDMLKIQLSRSVIVSPIDGRTGIRQVDAGNMVHTSDAAGLVVITQVEPISVVFTLPEKTLRPISDHLAKGETISVLAMDADNKNVVDEGTLSLVDNQVNTASNTISLKASFPNHKRLLWPGATVHIRLLTSTLKNAVVVPVAAIHTAQAASGDQRAVLAPWVYVYKAASHTIEMRTVKPGITQDGYTVIEQGLHADESIVTDTLAPLADGSRVAPQSSLTAAQ